VGDDDGEEHVEQEGCPDEEDFNRYMRRGEERLN